MNTAILFSRIILGLAFLAAGCGKLGDLEAFRVVLSKQELLPSFAIRPIAWIIVFLELTLALGLLAGFYLQQSGMIATGLLSLFTLSTFFNLFRGKSPACGCLDLVGKIKTGWLLFPRNIGFMFLSLNVIQPANSRLFLLLGIVSLLVSQLDILRRLIPSHGTAPQVQH